MNKITIHSVSGVRYTIEQSDINQFIEYCKAKPTCGFCANGGYQGGPGFFGFGQCKVCEQVRYGGKIVNPLKCDHFELASNNTLTSLFISLCSHYPDHYCTGEYLNY